MPFSFDLDTAAAHGKDPARLVAFVVTMAVRDGADRVTLGPDPRPGVVGAEMSYFVSGERHWLVPPPATALPRLMNLLRQLTDQRDNQFPVRLRGHEFAGRVIIESANLGEHATIDLPLLPALAADAATFLASHLDENGCVEFEDAEFA
jgi:hypothetical protein